MSQSLRVNNRSDNKERPISLTVDYQKNPLSSVLIEYGNTKVICSVSFTPGVPKFMKGTETGWLTAEYSMLPSATLERTARESSRGKQSGRSIEIQRLIGRVLRNCVKLEDIGENTLTVDCDVIQADGGTRTASISGAAVALKIALDRLVENKKIPAKSSPLLHLAAAVSIGLVNDSLLVDLDYLEDSQAQADMNFVFDDKNQILEVQVSAEQKSIAQEHLQQSLQLAQQACANILEAQKKVC